jgi:hypothetical protein
MPKDTKKKKLTTSNKTRKLELTAEVLTERHPVDVDINTPNPLLDSLLGLAKTAPGPTKVIERPVLAQVATQPEIVTEERRCPNRTRWNPAKKICEKTYFEIRINDIELLVSKKYEREPFRPTEKDYTQLKRLESMKIGDLFEIMDREGIPRRGRIKDDLIFFILAHFSVKPQPVAPSQPRDILEEFTEDELRELERIEKEQAEEEVKADVEQEVAEEEVKADVEQEVAEEQEQEQEPIPVPSPSPTEQQFQEALGTVPNDIESNEYNAFLFQREKIEHDIENSTFTGKESGLYPHLNDPQFNVKIAKRKEFQDTKYDGKIYDIREHAEKMCNAEFELMPHQLFIKNFLSLQTPYNCLLLYAGLGTGKTCSAIGVAEEMRAYMKQIGLNQRILVIASPNVQTNFRLQLFDERKLKRVGNIWNLDTCIGNALLKEVNPTDLQGLTRDKVASQINSLINQYYAFMGYFELANYIQRKTQPDSESGLTAKEAKELEIKRIHKFFDNRLVIIDEVHNIRLSQDNNKQRKKTASLLMRVAQYANNMRLLLLSATPMYNSYKEIIWIANLMNMVDKRSTIREEDVFDKEGGFLPQRTTKDGRVLEGGRELLTRKLTGYISFVRGENPYTFPYRIYPDSFAKEKTFKGNSTISYPTVQMNKKPIEFALQHIPVYLTPLGSYQSRVYHFIMDYLRTKSFSTTTMYGEERDMPSFENMESFGYMHLQEPLQSLIMTFPSTSFDSDQEEDLDMQQAEGQIKNMIGGRGLGNHMTFKIAKTPNPLFYDFEYRRTPYGSIFSPSKIRQYSEKIATVCDQVLHSKGIVLIYTEYIEGGILPLGLALEEIGFQRYGFASHTRNLFKTPPTDFLDVTTMKPRVPGSPFRPAKYVMITGNKALSPNNLADLKYATSPENKDGDNVKVILISRAAAEGLDFKNIRQVHILEPWYNLSRMEQIIGRGVRNLSHCQLPLEQRNVEIFLHAAMEDDPTVESADLYVYRYAEKKATQIGQITRLMKEIAVDCILNIGQTNLTVDKINALVENQNIKLSLSTLENGEPLQVDYKIGDKPFTEICDYMDNCNFTCSPTATIQDTDIIKNTYSEEYAKTNYSAIVKRIRAAFREQVFYKRDVLIGYIQAVKVYPVDHIDYALSRFVESNTEILLDQYGRTGNLTNVGEYYVFQPMEITDDHASIFERSVPIPYKHAELEMELPKEKAGKITNITTAAVAENAIGVQSVLEKVREQLAIMATEKQRAKDKLPFTGGEIDWFKHAGRVHSLLTEIHEIPEDTIYRYSVYHSLDGLPLQDRLMLLSGFSSENLGPLELEIRGYFDGKRVKSIAKSGIILADKNKATLYIERTGGQWTPAEPLENREFQESVQKKFTVDKTKINQYVGFMNLFKDDEMVFKTKDILEARNNKGAKCSSAGKKDIMKRLNKILEANPVEEPYAYTDENAESILKPGLCVILEMVVRHFNETTDRIWFFDVEMTLANRLTTL